MYKRILVPIDGSPAAGKALLAALQLAREAGGSVRITHAAEQFAFEGGDLRPWMRERAAKILSDALTIARRSGVEVDASLVDRPAARLGDAIATVAREWHADLIVVGTRGRKGLSRLLRGSGAEQVVRDAPVPALVVHQTGLTPPAGAHHV